MADSLSPTHELESLSEVEQAEFQTEFEHIKNESVSTQPTPWGKELISFDCKRDTVTGLDDISVAQNPAGDLKVLLNVIENEDGHALLGALQLRNFIADEVESVNQGSKTVVTNGQHFVAHDQNNVTGYIPDMDTHAAVIIDGEDGNDVIDYLVESGRLSEIESAVLKDSIEETFGPKALTPATEPTDPNPPETGLQDANTVNTAATMGLG